MGIDCDALYWLGLSMVEGLGVRGAHKLVGHLGSPKAAYMASLTELEGSGLPAAVCQSIFAQAGLKEAERELEAAERAGCHVVYYEHSAYPSLLRQISDPPLVLYVKGNVEALSGHCLAVVGSRRPSAYGLQVARKLARDLAERGLVIVSGLARGIDSAAHHGALEANGKTIAVQGRGMDRIYPSENKRLAERIAESGAVISEFPMGTGPTPENFPIRNRIISGLSLGVMVVEASEYSGSLITARLATEQNREVFAVPGNITAAQSFGPNHLIKQGAKLVDEWMDVVDEFPPEVRMQLLPTGEASDDGQGGEEVGRLFEESMTPEQRKVFEALRVDEALFVDSILGSVSLPQAQVLQALLELEMNGLVRQLPGKNFIRKL
ncbi:MAG TPA: DNA-processing protein DprA [Terriglobia bacterium]|nr:DNA-processing protein DprA [Terriglobia bacterium]